MSKEYFQIYYKNHKEEYIRRNGEILPEKKKEIKSKYYKKNRKRLLKYAKEYQKRKKLRVFVKEEKRVLGLRIKPLKPFNQRISQELRDKMKENTKINNEKIKFYS